ncbi:hypothetical protein [Streptomyces sp. NPDC003730]
MTTACRRALRSVGLAAHDVERLYGYCSVPPYVTPNPLYLLHQRLGLSSGCLVVPINSEYSNFPLGLLHAHEAVAAGGCRNALVVSGSNWTRHLDYAHRYAAFASDGAGAAVVQPHGHLSVIDSMTHTASDFYESMTMKVRPRTAAGWSGLPLDATGTPLPTYALHPGIGLEAVETLMRDELPNLVRRLLDRNDLPGARTALITHQGSRRLLTYWKQRIEPAEYLETFTRFGNLTNATYPVNLAYHFDSITSPYLVIASVGTGFHLTALLMKNHGVRQ